MLALVDAGRFEEARAAVLTKRVRHALRARCLADQERLEAAKATFDASELIGDVDRLLAA
jgi:hypothetical protein